MSGWGSVTGLAALLAALHSAAAVWLVVHSDTAGWRLTALCGAGRDPAWTGFAQRLASLAGRVCDLSLPYRKSAAERHRRTAAAQLCFALAAELRAGRTPAEALERAVAALPAERGDELTGVVTASRTGGDVTGAFHAAAARGGAKGLRRLAACWQVGSGSGAGFAAAVEHLAGALRAEEEHRQEVAARLAGPRSTGRLLAALPVLGLLMSAGMGMRPFEFLLGNAYGLVCLAAGAGLDIAGVVWTHRLARHAEERG